MINVTYKIQGESVDLRSDLVKPYRTEDSDIYIKKQRGWLSLSVGFNPSLNPKSQIFDIRKTKKHTHFKTNTTAVKLTDVVVDSKPYFYKVVDTTALPRDAVFKDGVYYTNSSDGTVPVIEDYEVIFRSKYIEIVTVPDAHIDISPDVITATIINPYSAYLPSFYLEVDNKLIRCIESNIKLFTAKATVTSGNYLKYKLSTSHDNLYFGDEDKELLFKMSSHCLSLLKFKEFFKVSPDGSISEGTKDDYTFFIYKTIDTSKIIIHPNNYKAPKQYTYNPLGRLVNTYEEDDASINDFGIRYRNIRSLLPSYNYINQIHMTPGGFEYQGVFKTKSLTEDGFRVEAINPSFITEGQVILEGKNYYVD